VCGCHPDGLDPLDLEPSQLLPGLANYGVGTWRIVRRLPLAAMISPQFVRRRDDKHVNPIDLGLAQITSLVDVPLADADARQFTLPASEILRRDVWTKQVKG
jgi:hypothetical protein